VTVRRGIAQDGADTREKGTKAHQRRRLAIDPETVVILTEHWDRCRNREVMLERSAPTVPASKLGRQGATALDMSTTGGPRPLAHK